MEWPKNITFICVHCREKQVIHGLPLENLEGEDTYPSECPDCGVCLALGIDRSIYREVNKAWPCFDLKKTRYRWSAVAGNMEEGEREQ